MQEQNSELNVEAVTKGADFLEAGVTDFSDWSLTMVYQFGSPVRPHLERIWILAQEEWHKRQAATPALPLVAPPQIIGETARCNARKQQKPVVLAGYVLIAVLLLVSLGIQRQRSLASRPGISASKSLTNVTVGPGSGSVDELLARAEKGDVTAQLHLAVSYTYGSDVPKDQAKAVHWYRKAAEQGSASAQYSLGYRYDTGKGVPTDYDEAMKWYRKSAEQGDADAQDSIGDMYLRGRGVPSDAVEAVKWYREAAGQSNWFALESLGECYELGQGVKQDYLEAITWYEKAAEHAEHGIPFMANEKLAGCCYKLGRAYLVGEEGFLKDEAEGLKWLRKAAEQGDAGGEYMLGLCYATGLGGQQNAVEARKWSLKAAEYYLQSAENGDADSQLTLAGCYDNAHDYPEAVKWYRRAAEQGNPGAQMNLGLLYRDGQGVPKDDIEAYKWLNIAAVAGWRSGEHGEHQMAAEPRDLLAQSMSRGEIAEAQRRAAAFIPRKESTEASDGSSPKPQPFRREGRPRASGTAFCVTDDGYLLSNCHVVQGASRVAVKTSRGLLPASVVRRDTANDIALLKVSGSFSALPLASSGEAKQGAAVFTVGYPNIDLQGVEPKLTKGEISSASGALDDPRQFQISVAVQPGNSGGPLVNGFGNVIGIVTARLSDAAAYESSGALPQNVNYATKISYALPLLEAVPGLAGRLKAPHPAKDRKFEDVVQEARAATVLVLVY